jgi:AAA15 family ATPase/GTPase
MKKLVFKHENSDVSFDMEEESEGTQRLYDLLAMIVSKEEDNIYILDELDLKLHPQLTFKFVELFLKEKAGTKNQLIFSSHESNLMDFKLLRRDEIWFVEKNESGSSSLYSLEDFNERTDKKVDKAYLEGRYGGVPVFSTVFPI